MEIKPIFIFFIILGLLSISIVMAAEIDINSQSSDNVNIDPISEMLVPKHHTLHHMHEGNNQPKNDFTIDTYILEQISS